MNKWIKLYKKMLDNPIVCKDADHFAVWCYLLLNCDNESHEVIFSGSRISLPPGQILTSRDAISSKLKISSSKVHRILRTFESDKQIEQLTSSSGRLVTIVNWDLYQG